MPDIDYSLSHQARKFITGANVHMINTWIFLYENSLPDSGDRERYEKHLREFVTSQSSILAARIYAAVARKRSLGIRRLSDMLNREIENLTT